MWKLNVLIWGIGIICYCVMKKIRPMVSKLYLIWAFFVCALFTYYLYYIR